MPPKKQTVVKNDGKKQSPTDSSINKIGNYTIVQDIGHGGFADVYKVKNNQGKEFAMKKIRRYCSIYEKSSDITTDVSFLSKVNHKFILKLVESFRDEESVSWCIVTELCKEDLRKPIDRKIKAKQVFSEDTILDWFGMIASALDHLHDKKILHRDLKPENVLLLDDNTVKLSDFGFAKFLEADASKFSRIGALSYMAPEVWNRQPYDMKCDVWSLGVVLFELCNLHNDFHQTNKEIPSRFSKALQTTVKQLLEENPAERPNIKTVCHIQDLHKNMRSSVGKKEPQPNSAASALSSQDGNNSVREESGYSSIPPPSTSKSDKQKHAPDGATATGQAKGSSSANELKKRLAAETTESVSTSPSTSTATAVKDRVETNVPSVQSNIPVPTDTIIAFGEYEENEIWRTGKNEWTKWTKGRDCGWLYACVKAHSNIYIIGGWRGEKFPSPETDIYDISREGWSKGPQLKVGRSGAAACFDVYNSQIIVVGGCYNYDPLNSVERLKVDGQGRPLGEWEQMKSMMSKGMRCAAAVLEDRLFVSGGYTDDGTTASVVMIDLKSDTTEWKQCAPMNEERWAYAMIAFNNQLFVFGGWDGQGIDKLASGEKYSPMNNTWQNISNMRVARSECGVCLMGDRIYVVAAVTKMKMTRQWRCTILREMSGRKAQS